MNIDVPGVIKSIDMNILGNKYLDDLELYMWPDQVDYNVTRTVVSLSGSSTTSEINLGTYSILPENKTQILRKVKDFNLIGSAAFTSITNPSVWLSTNNPAVVAWIEGDNLKAKYIGADITQFNDGNMELNLVKTFGQGTNYNLVNITDYVSVQTAHGKKISGVQ